MQARHPRILTGHRTVSRVQEVVGIDPELSRVELAVRLLRPVAVLCALHLYRFGFAGARVARRGWLHCVWNGKDRSERVVSATAVASLLSEPCWPAEFRGFTTLTPDPCVGVVACSWDHGGTSCGRGRGS